MTTLTKQAYGNLAARARTLANQATTEAARTIHVQIVKDYEAKAASLAVVGSYPTSTHASCPPADADADCSTFQPMSEKRIAGSGTGNAPESRMGDGTTALVPPLTGGSKLALVLNTAAVIIFTIIFASDFSVSGKASSSARHAILTKQAAKPLGALAAKHANLKIGEPYGAASRDVLIFQRHVGGQ